MRYQLDKDPYIDQSTGVFRNLLGYTDSAELAALEADVAAARSIALSRRPLNGTLDLGYMCAIHRQLFGKLYPWAGKLRTVEMSKGETDFCHVGAIEQFAHSIFEEIAHDTALDLPEAAIVAGRLAHYYSELNLLHPFREGNGRTLRVLIQELARRHGWLIDWSTLEAATNLAACIAAHQGDETPLAQKLLPLLERLDEA